MPPKNKKNLSSPRTSPVYQPGAIAIIRPQNNIADYQSRLAKSYKTPIKKKVAPLPVNTGADEANQEYTELMNKYKGNLAKQREAAANLFAKNKGALEADRGIARESLLKQRGSDLDDIAQSYAARGIGRSSGIYQQAGTDYESTLADRLKNTEDTFAKQIQREEGTQKETVAEAEGEYGEGLAEAAARKAAALESAKKEAAPTPKERPKQLPKPIAPKKQAPKYKLVDSRGKGR